MKKVLRKFILSDKPQEGRNNTHVIQKRISNVRSIWHNEHQDDVGLEKVLRLFLAASQFVFPGIYIKQLFGYRGVHFQELAIDLYILAKIFFPFCLLYFGLPLNPIVISILTWLLLETILYISTLVFASDLFDQPRSYRRSMLLLFMDYFQIVLSFAVLYKTGNHLNQPFVHWFDPIYFSVVTSATVGYGDFHPTTAFGKLLATSQIVIFFIVVMFILNFFSHRMEQKGYFGNKE
ncbi:MAG: potassium channel family protein [Bacteroidota bacterium]